MNGEPVAGRENRLALWIVAAALVAGPPAGAGSGSWTRTGPFGGRVNDVVLSPTSPTTLYAATAFDGVFRSTDGGASWSNPDSEGRPGLVGELVGGADGSLFAALGSGRSGILKSTDGGASWVQVNESRANCLAVDSGVSPTVYAGVSGQGVLKSTDGGASWTASDTGIVGLTVQALAVDPTVATTIYAGTSRDGVFKSTDGGATWTAANTGMEKAKIREIVVDPVTPANLFAATSDSSVLKSTNAGVSWSAASTGLPTEVETIALDPTTPATMFAAGFGEIFKSVDSGANWASLALPGTGVRVDSLVVDPTLTTTVYAGTGAGVWKTTDGGTSWTETNSGLTAFYAGGIFTDPVTPLTVYAVSGSSGIAKSTDGGATWQGVNNGLPSREVVTNGVGLAIAPSQPQTLYVSLDSTVFKSADGGANWTDALLNPGVFVEAPRVVTVAVDPADPATVFAGNFGGMHPLIDFGAGLYRTTSGGTSWQRVHTAEAQGVGFGTFQPTDMVVDPSDGDRVYAGVLRGGDVRGWAVLRSVDGGDSWEEALSGLGSFLFPDLAVDPLTGAVYVTVESGNVLELHKSTDSGASWTQLAVDPAFSCTASEDLFSDGSGSGALFLNCLTALNISTDLGLSWQGLPTNGFAAPIDTDAGALRALAAADTSPRMLHAGTFGGVYSFTADLADLEISKTDGLSEVEPGPLTYTIEARNVSGPDDAFGAMVSDVLSADLTCSWACVASGGASCTAAPPAGNLADLANLPVGGSAVYTATCTLAGSASGTLTNTATLQPPAAGVVDYQAANDSATDTTLILETGACGEFDERHLTDQVVNTTLVISACSSIRADSGFTVGPSGVVTFVAPKLILGDQFSVLGTFTTDNSVP